MDRKPSLLHRKDDISCLFSVEVDYPAETMAAGVGKETGGGGLVLCSSSSSVFGEGTEVMGLEEVRQLMLKSVIIMV